MKLLFDQKISFRIISKLSDLFPGSVQMVQIGLENTTDFEIWAYARAKSYCVVSVDSDFMIYQWFMEPLRKSY